MMDNLRKAFEYACDKYYRIIYDREHCGWEEIAEGLLLNYASGNVILLSDKGMYHIKNTDIVFMRPVAPRIDKLSEEFKEILESFKKDSNK
jgi:hypothetical protein